MPERLIFSWSAQTQGRVVTTQNYVPGRIGLRRELAGPREDPGIDRHAEMPDAAAGGLDGRPEWLTKHSSAIAEVAS